MTNSDTIATSPRSCRRTLLHPSRALAFEMGGGATPARGDPPPRRRLISASSSIDLRRPVQAALRSALADTRSGRRFHLVDLALDLRVPAHRLVDRSPRCASASGCCSAAAADDQGPQGLGFVELGLQLLEVVLALGADFLDRLQRQAAAVDLALGALFGNRPRARSSRPFSTAVRPCWPSRHGKLRGRRYRARIFLKAIDRAAAERASTGQSSTRIWGGRSSGSSALSSIAFS